MSVLLVILLFAFFITLDYLVSRHKVGEEAPASVALSPPAPAPVSPEPVWVAGYQMPEGVHYHRGHTWVRLLDRATALVGLDDFARRLLGSAASWRLPRPGDHLRQGATSFAADVNGHEARFLSPVDGEVLAVNPELEDDPGLPTDDPYGRGWIAKIRTRDLDRNLKNLLSGTLAGRWMEDSREHLKWQLMALSGSVLQDGGEPVADFARHLSAEDWERLTHEFLLT